jgi:putative mRNA 3-end processing factor
MQSVRKMILKFFGGAQEVGRSSIMLKDETTLMLDYGIKLNNKIEYPVGMPNVDAFVLSHAHLDHSGFAPALYNEMMIPSFGTQATLELSEILLKDSLKIAKKEHMAERFHKRQIESFMHRYTEMDYKTPFDVGNFELEFSDAGHIAGSAVTLIENKNSKDSKRIVYTGDFKLEPQLLHKGAEIVKSDVLITEATYATREHPDRQKLIEQLIEKVKETLDNKGNALLPVFAVGRAQEVLAILYKHGLAQHTYLDGMARTATSIVLRNGDSINNADVLAKALEEAMVIGDRKDRYAALNQPSIILTTAGMLSGGPVLDYITRIGKNSQIMLTGYQVEGSNGRMLEETGNVVIDGKTHKIDVPVSHFDLSAHAGKSDLYEYIRKSSPRIVVCVHADADNSVTLAENLKLEGFEAHAPKIGDTIKLD